MLSIDVFDKKIRISMDFVGLVFGSNKLLGLETVWDPHCYPKRNKKQTIFKNLI